MPELFHLNLKLKELFLFVINIIQANSVCSVGCFWLLFTSSMLFFLVNMKIFNYNICLALFHLFFTLRNKKVKISILKLCLTRIYMLFVKCVSNNINLFHTFPVSPFSELMCSLLFFCYIFFYVCTNKK